MKILVIGNGADSVAHQFWPEAEVDKTGIIPGKKRTDYDALVSYFALPRVAVRESQAAIKAWVECVKQGGEIQIYVPSLEWAAEQILSESPSPAAIFHLFGTQTNQDGYFVSGYTLRDLRTLCEKAGINVTHARAGLYTIGEYECEMYLIVGLKK